MRIGVIGGGPAGLYFALLMKQADPGHDIEVVERNRSDATFGWGVVFSPDTLAELRDADHETFVRLEKELVRWDAIEIRTRGDVARSSGQGFSAISRRAMLRILQERCREVGVELVFEREIEDLSTWSDKDLIVAADGVNSMMRRRYEPAFGASYRLHPTRYAWFGTDLVFDAFTFIFRRTDWGLFQVHAYPFAADMSTFIVETNEDTWERAGLDRLGEDDSLAFCQDLFAEHLGDHHLYSNRSLWTNFLTVSCESWYHDNIVLVGDAAHTAHFSIGSGTKLAAEDAVALVKAFREHPGQLQPAFGAYQLERQGPVRRFQDAAGESSGFFEHASRYLGFSPEQFAFNLLTRSGRITHRSLEIRDARIVAAADRWFADPEDESDSVWRAASPPRLVPLHIRDVTLANRVVLAAGPLDSAEEGVPSSSEPLAVAAATGVGMVVTEATAVSPEGRVTSGSPGLYDDVQLDAWERILHDAYAAGPTAVALRLTHAGPRAATSPRGRGTDRSLGGRGWPLVAASPIPYTRRSIVPKQADSGHLRELVTAFGTATDRATEAGFDVLIIDAASGHLLASFISPLTNRRDDEFGGDLHGRLRFPTEVVRSVRERWAGPLGIRLAVTDWHQGGISHEDAVTAASLMGEAGVDLVEVCGGQSVFVANPEYRPQYRVWLADLIRNEAGVLTMVGGNITTFEQIDTILGAGRADVCVLNPRFYERSPVTPAPPAGAKSQTRLERSHGR